MRKMWPRLILSRALGEALSRLDKHARHGYESTRSCIERGPPVPCLRAKAHQQLNKMAKKNIYKVVFHQQGNLYELHARDVSHSEMYGFLEIGDIIFGERSALLVDPSEEKLKTEFAGVTRTFVPIHAIVRVDEVAKEGANKITAANAAEGNNITQFPTPGFPSPGGSKK